jgi:hypothetical protein
MLWGSWSECWWLWFWRAWCCRDFFSSCKVKEGLTLIGVFLEGASLTLLKKEF